MNRAYKRLAFGICVVISVTGAFVRAAALDSVHWTKIPSVTVVSAAGAGGDGLLTINFPNVGQKMVMLKYAPLERV